jgi:ADP-heptose:LPS heptosyltransferase
LYKIINKKKLIATIIIDFAGKLIFGLPNLLKKKEIITPGSVREILIIRTAYMGDVVMTLPILKPLKERFPDSRITFLTSSGAKDVLLNNPFIDDILIYDPFWFYPKKNIGLLKFIRQLKEKRFDLLIEARGDIRDILFLARPAIAKYKVSYGVGGGAYFLTHVIPYPGIKHKVEYHLDLIRYLGCQTNENEWGIYLTDDEKENVGELLKKYQITKPFICAHPGARLKLKRWPIDSCAKLYDIIIKKYKIPLIILGSNDEKELVSEVINKMNNDTVNLSGKLNLRILSGILSEARLFICNDSGPMHIAATMGTPTVAIFGPSKSIETSPYGNRHIVIEKNLPCRYSCDESNCHYERHHACMMDIQVEDAYNAVTKLIKQLDAY